MSLSVRFDGGKILRQPEFTPEGFLRAEAVFAKDGILEYRTPNGGIVRELRTPAENQRILTKFGLKPLSLEHPPELITPQNAKRYADMQSVRRIVRFITILAVLCGE